MLTTAILLVALGQIPSPALAVGADAGNPLVRVYKPDGTRVAELFAFDHNFSGGVRVALGDFNGDGVTDLFTAAGPGGGPHLRIWDGADLTKLLAEAMVLPADFRGGVFVAAADLDRDGKAEAIIGAGQGGAPQVRVFRGGDLTKVLASALVYDKNFRGGVRLTTGDMTGDGRPDILVAPGGGEPRPIRVIDGLAVANGAGLSQVFAEVYPFGTAFRGGVFPATADCTGDGRADLIVGAAGGGGPHLRVLNGANYSLVTEKMVYDPGFGGGVRPAALTVGGAVKVVVLPGPGGGPHLQLLSPALTASSGWFAFDQSFRGGAWVAAH